MGCEPVEGASILDLEMTPVTYVDDVVGDELREWPAHGGRRQADIFSDFDLVHRQMDFICRLFLFAWNSSMSCRNIAILAAASRVEIKKAGNNRETRPFIIA
jgi:hypothetical protein